jgi:uncharacterized protein YbjT (DUF2867 family)
MRKPYHAFSESLLTQAYVIVNGMGRVLADLPFDPLLLATPLAMTMTKLVSTIHLRYRKWVLGGKALPSWIQWRHIDERRFMSNAQAAVVLGASGSVGNALVRELIRNGSFKTIVTLARRSQPDQVAAARDAGVELRETLVPTMDPASLENATAAAIRSLEGGVVGLSVLGVGAGTAKLTIEKHRAVDVQLNAAFARGLKASGRVKHLAFMSAAGADPTAATTGSGAAGMARYARVKGEAEEAVKESGPPVVSIFRPAMIIGSQHTPWLLEKVVPIFSFMTPAKYKSITVEQIAKAMIATSVNTPVKSDIYYFSEMMSLNR